MLLAIGCAGPRRLASSEKDIGACGLDSRGAAPRTASRDAGERPARAGRPRSRHPGRRRRRARRRRLPLRAGGPHGLRAPLRAPDVPGQREPGEARPLPARPELGRRLQRLHPPGLHRLLRGAARRGAGAGAVPGGRPAARAHAHRGEPAQPGRRGQGGDPAQRPQPALRRLPLDPAAAGALRHVPQRAQRLRRLHRAGAGLPRRRRGVLRHLLRAGQRAGHGRGLPRRRRGAARWSRSTSATSRPAPTPTRPSFAEPPPGAERREAVPDAHAPLPALAVGYRLPDPATDLDGYLGHALLGSRARRRRGRPPAAAPRARRRAGHRRLRGRGPDGRRSTPATPTRSRSPRCTPRPSTPTGCSSAVDEELDKLAAEGPTDEELRRPGRPLVGGAATRRTTA